MIQHVPAVSFPVGRTPSLGMILLVLVLGAWLMVAVACGWPFSQACSAPGMAVFIVSSVGAALGCGWFWRSQRIRRLNWDGASWWLKDTALASLHEGAWPQVRWDAQRWMLLWFCPLGSQRGIWLWAQASAAPECWHPLRCALYARAAVERPDAIAEHA